VIRPCEQDPFYRYFPKNCELAPAITVIRHRPVHHQTWSQALTDAIWHSPVFRIAAAAVVLAVIPVLAALVLAYVRQRRGRTGQLLATPAVRSTASGRSSINRGGGGPGSPSWRS
jgi:hypothetical protein